MPCAAWHTGIQAHGVAMRMMGAGDSTRLYCFLWLYHGCTAVARLSLNASHRVHMNISLTFPRSICDRCWALMPHSYWIRSGYALSASKVPLWHGLWSWCSQFWLPAARTPPPSQLKVQQGGDRWKGRRRQVLRLQMGMVGMEEQRLQLGTQGSSGRQAGHPCGC